MNAVSPANLSDVWFITGWTMIHFMWLGALVAAAAVTGRTLLRRASANVRYIAALASLILLAALPPMTAIWLVTYSASVSTAESTKPIVATSSAQAPTVAEAAPTLELPSTTTLSAPGSAGGSQTLASPNDLAGTPTLENPRQSRGLPANSVITPPTKVADLLNAFIPYLPWLWLIGTPLTFALLISGVVGTRRLSRASRIIEDDPIVDLLAHLAASLHISRRVVIAVCDRVASPVLIGILRPMILLPPAALTGWSPDEIEMVLLHELAHVRRWDNLVNLLQRCLESLLFFHPAVWLLSAWVRSEREACCDATVVARTNRPHAYAELLVALAAQLPRSVLFHPAASSAMAAGPLRSRIRQILNVEDDSMLITGKSLALMLGSMIVAAALIVLYVPSIGHADTKESAGKDPSVATALNEYRKTLITYDLGFDSVFPNKSWTTNDLDRLKRYPTADAWPNVLGHVDTDASAFHSVNEKPNNSHEDATGPNAYEVPLTWSIGIKNYATLLFLKGIEKDAHIVANSYTSFACFGPMAGDTVFASYATALVDGDLTGRITANSYFDLVVTGKMSGQITAQNYAMIYLMGGFTGQVDLKHSRVYIAGNTSKAELERVRGVGQVYLEESDLPAGNQTIGELEVYVKKSTASGLAVDQPELLEFTLRRGANGESNLFLNGKPITEDQLHDLIPKDASRLDRITTSLKVDAGVPYSEMMKVVNDLEATGLKRLTLDTRNLSRTAKEEAEETEEKQLSRKKDSPAAASASAPQSTPSSSNAENKPKSKFPSLAEQKLADAAYKQLNLELEPLGEADLKRVKALGYDGGVKVIAGKAGNGPTIDPDDILVGLHVWPTTNMSDVVQILNRQDLGELNPLKFYVVRHGSYNPEGSDKTVQLDGVATGRVQVKMPPDQQSYQSPRGPTYADPNPPGNQPYGSDNPPAAATQPSFVQSAPSSLQAPSQPQPPQQSTQPQPQPEASNNPYAAPALATSSPSYSTQPDHNSAVADSSRFSDSMPADLNVTDADKAFKHAAEQFERAATAKQNALANREHAKDTEAAKRELENVNREFEKSKQEFEKASASLKLPWDSAKLIEYALQRKNEAMDRRLAAKTDKEVEASKRDLEAANKQLEEVKRQIEESKRRIEIQDRQQEEQNVDRLHKDADGLQSQPGSALSPAVISSGDRYTPAEPSTNNAELHNIATSQTVASESGSTRSTASTEELEILRDRVKSLEDQNQIMTERFKAGRGATQVEVMQSNIDLRVAKSELALAEEHRNAAVKEMQDALHLAEDVLEAEKASARAGIASPDVEGVAKATKSLSDLKLKLIRLKQGATQPNPGFIWGLRAQSQPEQLAEPKADAKPTSNFPPPPGLPAVSIKPGLDITTADGTVLHTSIIQRTAPDGRPVFETAIAPDQSTAPANSSNDQLGIQPRTSSPKPNLRYDGKSFNEWQSMWLQGGSHDPAALLNTMSALEAFANAGLDREANPLIERGLYFGDDRIQQQAREYLHSLSKSDAGPIVVDLLNVLHDDLSPTRRVAAMRGLAAIGPNAESALPALKEALAKKNPSEIIPAATAIKMIVGKDQYQKPIADVLGDNLQIKVVQTPDGKWAALPTEENTNNEAFNDFNSKVIEEQDNLYSEDYRKQSK